VSEQAYYDAQAVAGTIDGLRAAIDDLHEQHSVMLRHIGEAISTLESIPRRGGLADADIEHVIRELRTAQRAVKE
jgi:hypothetical protein